MRQPDASEDDPLDQYDALVMAGRAPDPEVFAARFPDPPRLLARISRLNALRGDLDRAVAPKQASRAKWPDRIAGFVFTAKLGEGGMGAVFSAIAPDSGSACAVKLLREPAGRLRFTREAELCAKLDHPGITRLLSHGEEQGRLYLVAELVSGRTLKEILAADPELGRSPERVVEWGLQVCDALSYAHARGVIHRDLKPSNLMLDSAGRVHLIDFGVAMDSTARGDVLTRTGVFVGSHNYAAPEQLHSQREAIGPWTDVYGLGATLYELLSGQPAFDFPTHWARVAAEGARPLPLKKLNPKVPRRLSQVVLRALAPAAKRRFASAADLAAALRGCL